MCYIFSCFGWALDLVQRFITFFLACCLCYAVSLGLAVALVAGIAYGYHYSLAELNTITRSDVTVFMKRGQFYDRPDIFKGGRRMGGAEVDMFGTQAQSTETDFNEISKKSNEVKLAPETLSEPWQNAQDTRNYAERLVKYEFKPPQHELDNDMAVSAQELIDPSSAYQNEQSQQQLYFKSTTESLISTLESTSITFIAASPGKFSEMTIPWTSSHDTLKPIEITPNLEVSTAIYDSGRSPILMRNFRPIQIAETPESDNNHFEDSNKVYDRFRNMELVETPDYSKPSYVKNLEDVFPRMRIVNKINKVPPFRESQYNQEYEESGVGSKKHWRQDHTVSTNNFPTDHVNFPNGEYFAGWNK